MQLILGCLFQKIQFKAYINTSYPPYYVAPWASGKENYNFKVLGQRLVSTNKTSVEELYCDIILNKIEFLALWFDLGI